MHLNVDRVRTTGRFDPQHAGEEGCHVQDWMVMTWRELREKQHVSEPTMSNDSASLWCCKIATHTERSAWHTLPHSLLVWIMVLSMLIVAKKRQLLAHKKG